MSIATDHTPHTTTGHDLLVAYTGLLPSMAALPPRAPRALLVDRPIESEPSFEITVDAEALALDDTLADAPLDELEF